MSRCTLCGERVWFLSLHRYCLLARELDRVKGLALEAKLASESALKIAETPAKPQLPADTTEALTQLQDALLARLEFMRPETENLDLARGWNAATRLTLDDIDCLLQGKPPWIVQLKQGDKQK